MLLLQRLRYPGPPVACHVQMGAWYATVVYASTQVPLVARTIRSVIPGPVVTYTGTLCTSITATYTYSGNWGTSHVIVPRINSRYPQSKQE